VRRQQYSLHLTQMGALAGTVEIRDTRTNSIVLSKDVESDASKSRFRSVSDIDVTKLIEFFNEFLEQEKGETRG
jgi:hypothetical protein